MMRLRRRILATLQLIVLMGMTQADAAANGVALPVPATTIYPGEIIDDTMITERTVQPSQVGRLMIVLDRSELLGKVARRTLLPGRPVQIIAVAEPDLVPRGTNIEVVFQQGGLTILAQAMTLEAGSAGDVIRVRNLDSGVIINATVQADGTVRVGAP
jgi:flagellar basal body P-ring formation protein FlgA